VFTVEVEVVDGAARLVMVMLMGLVLSGMLGDDDDDGRWRLIVVTKAE
jgi:hypothetical protein